MGTLPDFAAGAAWTTVRRALEDGGWLPADRGDWAWVYRSPDGLRAARVCPFDPAWALYAGVCARFPEVDAFPRIESFVRLAPAGHVAIMEWLEVADRNAAAELAAALGQSEHLGDTPSKDTLARVDEKRRQPDVAALRCALDAGLAEGRQTLAWFGGLDLHFENLRARADGTLVLVDPFFVEGRRIFAALESDLDAACSRYTPVELRAFLDISAFARNPDDPVPAALRAALDKRTGAEG